MKNQALASITENSAYKQTLSDLIALEIETDSIEEFTPDFEINPAHTAAMEAIRAGWLALAAIIDAHCTSQRC